MFTNILTALKSRTVISALVTVIASALALFGVVVLPTDIEAAISAITAIITALSGLAAIYFRLNPKSRFRKDDDEK